MSVGQGRSFQIFAGKEQLPHFWQIHQRFRIYGVGRAAGPQALFVQLDSLLPDAAEHHGRQRTVAQRQGIYPFAGRFRVPECNIRIKTGRLFIRAADDEK